MPSCFHLADHVTDLDQADKFYGDLLGCREGGSTACFRDPSGNPHDVKGFDDSSEVFAS